MTARGRGRSHCMYDHDHVFQGNLNEQCRGLEIAIFAQGLMFSRAESASPKGSEQKPWRNFETDVFNDGR